MTPASTPIRGLCGVLAFAALAAHAARPLNTDDANIVDAQSCQLESWVRSASGSTERWAIPGCNFTGGAEFSLGGSRIADDVAGRAHHTVLQGKFRLRPVEPDAWGLALTLGTQTFSGDRVTSALRDTYVNVPLTVALGADRFAHVNAGWVRHHATGQGRGTWGLAVEAPLGGPVIAVAEAFGEQATQARYQLGARFWIVPQRVQIDTTVGNSFSSPRGRWVSVGLRLLSPAFLP